jgi:hypothetical protein
MDPNQQGNQPRNEVRFSHRPGPIYEHVEPEPTDQDVRPTRIDIAAAVVFVIAVVLATIALIVQLVAGQPLGGG